MQPDYSTPSERGSTIFAMVMVSVTCMVTLYSFRLAWHNSRGADTARYSALFQGVESGTSFTNSLYTPLQLLRRIIVSASLVFMGNYPLSQVAIYLG